MNALSWQELQEHCYSTPEETRIRGPTNSQARLRLFGEVTMFCYGEKESWYKRIVPSGMLPALSIDYGSVITESDDILLALEVAFGPMVTGRGMRDADVVTFRRLERFLFRAWCQWLCYPSRTAEEEERSRTLFIRRLREVEQAISLTGSSPFMLDRFTVADVVFVPYLERMAASLFYYKGYDVKSEQDHPAIRRWFQAMESRLTYRGTQSDYHTHCHDLPPQMGGCYSNGSEQARRCARIVDGGGCGDRDDSGSGGARDDLVVAPDSFYGETVPCGIAREEGSDAAASAWKEALTRVCRHRETLVQLNPDKQKERTDEALRIALTLLVRGGQRGEAAEGTSDAPPSHLVGADKALRYMKDRVSVPRDMGVHGARRFRHALELAARWIGDGQGPDIPTKHRRDQNPLPFSRKK
eukprot:TRINITY_DN1396_c0_g1_i1.p1 TRINITY_DN1396_c0_g1~~TRINITY_DN1396_c0_g1_i1.p1  ORF type:complete len:413 (+),score=74.36 TRINITY_DN1396_c0_g1_i1:173-1411(+)